VDPATNTVYVTNSFPDNTVSVINGRTNQVTATIGVGGYPWQVAVNPLTNTAFVANSDDNTVSVINGRTNTVTATIGVGNTPYGMAVNPATGRLYVTNGGDATVSVIAPR
jgi:YVTN family beta-propeller protein